MPGQTLTDIAAAERRFLEEVRELHPEAEAKPALVGNCQAGWAIMMLSAYDPGPELGDRHRGGAASYWPVVEGKNPLRYSVLAQPGGKLLPRCMADNGCLHLSTAPSSSTTSISL